MGLEMKDEYGMLLFGIICVFVVTSIAGLITDLFIDGAFVKAMFIFLILWCPTFGIAFIIQLIRTNYKIIKKD